jgi:hypothetical protein
MVVPVFFFHFAILFHSAHLFVCVCVDYLIILSVSEVIETLVRDQKMGMEHL